MRKIVHLAAIVAVLGQPLPAGAERSAVIAAAHEELGGVLDDLAGQMQSLGARWRSHFVPGGASPERPLITLMLHYRAELGLSPEQVEALERLRSEFQREAIRRDADLRLAEMDLAALRRQDPADLARLEAKIREIERVRAELRLARIRAIEQGKQQLTPEQRVRLQGLLSEPGPAPPPRLGVPAPPPPPRTDAPHRL